MLVFFILCVIIWMLVVCVLIAAGIVESLIDSYEDIKKRLQRNKQ